MLEAVSEAGKVFLVNFLFGWTLMYVSVIFAYALLGPKNPTFKDVTWKHILLYVPLVPFATVYYKVRDLFGKKSETTSQD